MTGNAVHRTIRRRECSLAVPAIAMFCLLACAVSSPAGPRQTLSLDQDWMFALERDSGALSWQPVDLPHTWNAGDTTDKDLPYHRGVGRYRKTVVLSSTLADRRVQLLFEGANQAAEVRVNGQPVGEHLGGYTAFAFDITGVVRFGAPNVIEIRVDNRHDGTIPPLNADFTFYGGIYRDAWLVLVDDVHFALDAYAATEVRIGTPAMSRERATVTIDAGIENASGERRGLRVSSEIRDRRGRIVAQASVPWELGAGSSGTKRIAELFVEQPDLWSPESPRLYQVVVSLHDGDALLDRLRYPLGLRWYEADENGFRLNGEPYRLFGTNRHQDRAGLGNALSDEMHRADLERIKADGFNFLRLAHYPQDPAVLRAADEIGLLLWEEVPLVNLIDTSAAFRRNSTRMLREMIRQHRHHPSIVFWGYMNEIMLQEPQPLPDGYRETVLDLARHLDAVAREEDPQRRTIMALSHDEIGNGIPLHEVPDVLAMNLYFGWYYGELADLGAYLDSWRRRHPDIPLFVSEYGAGSDERLHSRRPVRFDFSTEYQLRFHEENFRQILDRPWLVGSAVWNQFDFGSNHREDTVFGVNQKGLWTFDRRPKDVAWFYRAQLRDEPVLYITGREWSRRAGSRAEDGQMPVRVYSNLPEVELFVNGRSAGSRRIRNASAEWMVELEQGDNELLAESGGMTDRVSVHFENRASLFAGRVDVSAAPVIAVNAGADEQYVDSREQVWEADRVYEKGSWGYTHGRATRSQHRIFDTLDDPLYQTQRGGNCRYRFDLPDGTYRLELRTSDLVPDAASEPASVVVNGLAIGLPAARKFAAAATTAIVEASSGDGVSVACSASPGRSFVNAILLQRLRETPAMRPKPAPRDRP